VSPVTLNIEEINAHDLRGKWAVDIELLVLSQLKSMKHKWEF
jgi:hypothetical protein